MDTHLCTNRLLPELVVQVVDDTTRIEAVLRHTTTNLSLPSIIFRRMRSPYRPLPQYLLQAHSIILKSIPHIRKPTRSLTDLHIIILSPTDLTRTRGQVKLPRLCQNICLCYLRW